MEISRLQYAASNVPPKGILWGTSVVSAETEQPWVTSETVDTVVVVVIFLAVSTP